VTIRRNDSRRLCGPDAGPVVGGKNKQWAAVLALGWQTPAFSRPEIGGRWDGRPMAEHSTEGRRPGSKNHWRDAWLNSLPCLSHLCRWLQPGDHGDAAAFSIALAHMRAGIHCRHRKPPQDVGSPRFRTRRSRSGAVRRQQMGRRIPSAIIMNYSRRPANHPLGQISGNK